MQKYPVTTISKLLNLSQRRVQQLAKDGVIPKADKGKYELVSCVQGYVKYLYDRAFGQNTNQIDSYAEKAGLLKVQKEKAELELAVMKEQYMKIDEIEFIWSNMVVSFRSKILSMPSKLAPMLTNDTSQIAKIKTILEDEVHDALLEMSKHSLNNKECSTSQNNSSDNGRVS